VRILGIDPGSDGSRHRIVVCGAIGARSTATFPQKLQAIHDGLRTVIGECRPDGVAIENLFYATNVRSALKLGHARGVAMLAAVEAGLSIAEYTPAEIKRAVVGYGRAEKHQVAAMVQLILGLSVAPTPHDAADALAVAICHVHSRQPEAARGRAGAGRSRAETSWRHYKPRHP